jgi:hypothetical protein
MIAEDEGSLSAPFWVLRDGEERVVQEILKRRFPETYSSLTTALDAADPMDIVYPGNPNEYSDVIREMLVLLAPVNGDLAKLTERELRGLLVEALNRCFGEAADKSRVEDAVRLLRQ